MAHTDNTRGTDGGTDARATDARATVGGTDAANGAGGPADGDRLAEQREPRRDVPGTVGLLADARDFAAMRDYRSFGFDDYGRYLRQTEALLGELAVEGVHIRVGLFQPAEYARYCAETGQDPDTARARTRYTAEITAAGPTVAYVGQPLDDLALQLAYEAGRQDTWDRAADLLAAAGDCADCGRDLAQQAFARATQALMRLLEAAGPGRHHLVCSVPADAQGLLAALRTHVDERGRPVFADPEALVFCAVLAAGIVTDSPGGVVLRSDAGGGTDQVRGWSLRDGWLEPLTEAEVFDAYCTDPASGGPVPPEPGVEYRAGAALTPPED
jgi:hypothetical protein